MPAGNSGQRWLARHSREVLIPRRAMCEIREARCKREEDMPAAEATPSRGYSRPMIVLHWSMFLVIAAVYAVMEWKGFLPKEDPLRDTLTHLHRSLGLVAFALLFVRFALRRTGTTPPIVPPPPAWQELASRAVHWALYALMLILPITGYLMSNAAGKSILFFGLAMPALIAPDEAVASLCHDVHEVAANLGYALIGLHAAAGLWHHYVHRDNTLRRMLPARR
jgi:cytochrome b561